MPKTTKPAKYELRYFADNNETVQQSGNNIAVLRKELRAIYRDYAVTKRGYKCSKLINDRFDCFNHSFAYYIVLSSAPLMRRAQSEESTAQPVTYEIRLNDNGNETPYEKSTNLQYLQQTVNAIYNIYRTSPNNLTLSDLVNDRFVCYTTGRSYYIVLANTPYVKIDRESTGESTGETAQPATVQSTAQDREQSLQFALSLDLSADLATCGDSIGSMMTFLDDHNDDYHIAMNAVTDDIAQSQIVRAAFKARYRSVVTALFANALNAELADL